ncbi:MAG: TRAP transporter substrate-binding protein [Acetobacteraceae bacterium]|nr:TRAP transporter substrate-binding protein [Rhodovarius sp.]MCX7685122.1 TRAP transporter substrate-binding protein [Acetobacteraceae bacterium]MDW8397833.1 TRAP transporter substrate-binding protein [Acetobacteraceae bacterium]
MAGITRRALGALTLAGAVTQAKPIRAQGPIRLRLGHGVPAPHPVSQWLARWAERVGRETNGALQIEVFPGGQLGPMQAYYDLIRRGAVDIGWILHGSTPDRFPLTGLVELPFTVSTAAIGTRVLNEPEIRARLEPEHRGLKVLFLMTHQAGHLLTVTRPVRTVADLRGMRIRFPSGPTRALLAGLGASPVAMPPQAIAENIERGVVDGLLMDYGGAGIAWRLAGIVKHSLEIGAYVASFAIAMNEDSYNRLPPDLRRAFDATLADAPAEVGPLWDGLDGPGKAALVQGGMEALVPTPEAMAEFRAIGRRVGQEIIAETDRRGLPASATYQAILSAAERHARGA